MHFLTPLLTSLLLTSTSTLALILPGNYTIIEVVPIDPEYLYNEAKDNPNVPLIYATLRCGRKYTPIFEDYTLTGENWDGVSEEQLEHAAKQGGLMTKWDYTAWGESECDPDVKSENGTCVHKNAGWRAKVSFLSPLSLPLSLAPLEPHRPKIENRRGRGICGKISFNIADVCRWLRSFASRCSWDDRTDCLTLSRS